MTNPQRRVLLVPRESPEERPHQPARRFRLARVSPASAPGGRERYAYLRRVYD